MGSMGSCQEKPMSGFNSDEAKAGSLVWESGHRGFMGVGNAFDPWTTNAFYALGTWDH